VLKPLPDPLEPSAVLPWEAEFAPISVERSMPGISIVIPIFNAGRFLEKTIRSLLCNDLEGVEIIVMDGGSTDSTADILAYYKRYFSHVVSERDDGQSDAINRGFARATKPILYWLNGDDVVLPNSLLPVRKCFYEAPETQVVVGNAYMTEIDFSPIRHFTFSDEALTFSHLLDYAANHLVQPSVFFSRTAWNTAGPVKADLHYAMDADLFLSMAKKFRLRSLPVDIAYSVYHEDCKTRGRRAESIVELGVVQAQHGGLAEARKTLGILIDMFNQLRDEADRRQQVGDLVESCTRCDILHQKLNAITEMVEANKRALLVSDLEVV
jgi:hypothetical protein